MYQTSNHPRCAKAGRGRPDRAAFSVAELMLAVAIMGVIIFALYSVFNQTQRALRSTEAQGDVAEKGRAIVDIISRELTQAKATFWGEATNTLIIPEINLGGGFERIGAVQRADRADIQPRTNFLHNLFFYTNHTNSWQAMGYRVVNVTNGVGVLVRFETNHFGGRPPAWNRLWNAFHREVVTNATFHHVADGVIHLSFIPYDASGYRLGFDTTNRTGAYTIMRTFADGSAIPQTSDVIETNNPVLVPNVILSQGYEDVRAETLHYATRFAFKSNALPSYIEMEFGILEPEALTQYYLMLKEENPNAQSYLERQVARVHLFRQRIPIRTAAQ